jgi:hypothetical protein
LQGSKADFSNLKGGGILMVLVFTEMINSSSFKGKLGKGIFIEMISNMIENCESQKGVIMDEYRKALF